jgi:hypothetical protein
MLDRLRTAVSRLNVGRRFKIDGVINLEEGAVRDWGIDHSPGSYRLIQTR